MTGLKRVFSAGKNKDAGYGTTFSSVVSDLEHVFTVGKLIMFTDLDLSQLAIRKRCNIYLKLTIKTRERRYLLFLLLTLNKFHILF